MSEMPLLAIEILSPKQGIYDILEKFKIYFTLGIKSCWLVIPATATVTVYSLEGFKSFNSGEVVDETLNIHLLIAEIFS
jgi:Uma2 family endonuclease